MLKEYRDFGHDMNITDGQKKPNELDIRVLLILIIAQNILILILLLRQMRIFLGHSLLVRGLVISHC